MTHPDGNIKLEIFFKLIFLLNSGLLTYYFIGYPLLAVFLSRITGKKKVLKNEHKSLPSVTVLTTSYCAEKYLEKKIQNTFDIVYPAEKLSMIVVLDGDEKEISLSITRKFSSRNIKVIHAKNRIGKRAALNLGCKECSTDIIVFSDVNALLHKDSVSKMIEHFSDPKIGGVCGREVVSEKSEYKSGIQEKISLLEHYVHLSESLINNICYNSGKIHAVRRELISDFPSGVSDDIYTCYTVVSSGLRFIYEPQAIAYLPYFPSISAGHEFKRRARITNRSLLATRYFYFLCNPFRTGFFAISMITNRILKRFVPLLIIANVCLLIKKFLIPTTLVLCLLLASWMKFRNKVNKFKTVTNTISFIGASLFGTSYGLFRFITGKKDLIWTPASCSNTHEKSVK